MDGNGGAAAGRDGQAGDMVRGGDVVKKFMKTVAAVLQSDEAALVLGVLLAYGYLRLALEIWDVLAGAR